MKSTFLKTFFVVALCSVAVSACKKDEARNQSSMLVGTWTAIEFGEDLNNNQQIDAGETETLAANNLSAVAEIRSDGTFTTTDNFSGAVQVQTGTYTFANNILTSYINNGDTTVGQIHELTNNRMVGRDLNSTPAQWMIYVK